MASPRVKPLDQQIAEYWPQRWEKANDARPGASKRRNRLRRDFLAWKKLLKFKQENPTAKCANCVHRGTLPHNREKHFCDLESWGGMYAIVKLDYVCMAWKEKKVA